MGKPQEVECPRSGWVPFFGFGVVVLRRLEPHRAGVLRVDRQAVLAHSLAGEVPRHLHVRASDQGFLPISVEHHVMLLDWTGGNSARTSAGRFRDHLAPIVERLGLDRSNWVETGGLGRLFKQAAGRSSSLIDAAAPRLGWFQGKRRQRAAFSPSFGIGHECATNKLIALRV